MNKFQWIHHKILKPFFWFRQQKSLARNPQQTTDFIAFKISGGSSILSIWTIFAFHIIKSQISQAGMYVEFIYSAIDISYKDINDKCCNYLSQWWVEFVFDSTWVWLCDIQCNPYFLFSARNYDSLQSALKSVWLWNFLFSGSKLENKWPKINLIKRNYCIIS